MDSSQDHPAGGTPPETRTSDPSFLPISELSLSSISSDIRKAKVRAALFDKLEPVKVGRFTLLERLGAGTMGEIYAAYDERLDRAVALKLVRPGSQSTIKADELLLREAQALAQVSHPNVVQIYDAGTHGGRVFIAMELIRGGTLTTWLGDVAAMSRSLRQREVLHQFIAAGRGLAAAHAAGVAHRDFKPDNVLVGKDGRVCVVDFGLARVVAGDAAMRSGAATGEAPAGDVTADETVPMGPSRAATKLTAATRLTRTGTVMGTPRFMAPEQIRGGVPDHRSDQFSFCVALYHALYGAFPFRGERPQELLTAIEAGVDSLEHGAGRGMRLRKALCRGLSVDPSQRFPSMGELLAALEPGLRRRRGWIAGAVLLFIAAAVAAFLLRPKVADPCATAGDAIAAAWPVASQTVIRAGFAASDLPYADTAWRGFQRRVDSYAGHWRDQAQATCRATFVDRSQSESQHDRRMLCLERGSRQLSALVDELAHGPAGALPRAVAAAEALPELDSCGRIENTMFGLEPPARGAAHDVAAVRDGLARARALEHLGRLDESLKLARAARTASEHLTYRPVQAEAMVQVARSLDGVQHATARREAEQLYFQALDIAEAERHDELAAAIWGDLVWLAREMDPDTKQAQFWLQRYAAAVFRIGNSEPDQARVHYLLGEIYNRDSRFAEATIEESLAIARMPDTPEHQLELSRYYDARAKSLVPLDRVDEAIALHERALKIERDALGASHPDVIELQLNYSLALKSQGEYERARAGLEAALASMAPGARDASLDAGQAHTMLSEVLYYQDKLDAAVAHGRAGRLMYAQVGAPDHRRAEAETAIANAELKRKHFADALAGYQRALELRRPHLADDNYQLGIDEGSVAEALIGLGRHDEAKLHLHEAERILARSSAYNRETRAWILTLTGQVLFAQHQLAAAIPVFEQALPLFEAAPDAGNQAIATWGLARALHRLGRDPGRVRQLAEKARALYAGLASEQATHSAVERFIAEIAP